MALPWNIVAAPLMTVVSKVLDFIPNPQERKRVQDELEREMSEIVNTSIEGQLETNKIEAAASTIFVAGWRPFIGWICGMSILWTYLAQPVLTWTLAKCGVDVSSFPAPQVDNLFELVVAMLGLGTLRTFEKVKGVSREK
jgi:hypothetical protein